MSLLVGWAIIITAATGWLVWWLIFETEGVYLGRRMVIWLYDVYAPRYDALVDHDDIEEHLHLAQPLMNRLQHPAPRVLDVATGTGRMPLALCQHARFEGHIVGVDHSHGMLAQAVSKICDNHFTDYVTFIHGNGQQLPFADNSFDVVTCMEALEFMPDPHAALAELCRVLRPGGWLLTTQRIQARWLPGRIWDHFEMQSVLEANAMQEVEFQTWQYDYNKVWARKRGASAFIGASATSTDLS